METTVKIQIITNVNSLLGNSTDRHSWRRLGIRFGNQNSEYNFGRIVDNASLSAKSFIIHFVCRINVFTINKNAIKLTLNLFRRGGSSPGSKKHVIILKYSAIPLGYRILPHGWGLRSGVWGLSSATIFCFHRLWCHRSQRIRHLNIEIGGELCGGAFTFLSPFLVFRDFWAFAFLLI